MGEVHNEFLLALYQFDIYNYQRFYQGRGTLLVDNAILEYWHNKFCFTSTHPIAIPIQWRVQHFQLNDLGIMEHEHLQDNLPCNGHMHATMLDMLLPVWNRNERCNLYWLLTWCQQYKREGIIGQWMNMRSRWLDFIYIYLIAILFNSLIHIGFGNNVFIHTTSKFDWLAIVGTLGMVVIGILGVVVVVGMARRIFVFERITWSLMLDHMQSS